MGSVCEAKITQGRGRTAWRYAKDRRATFPWACFNSGHKLRLRSREAAQIWRQWRFWNRRKKSDLKKKRRRETRRAATRSCSSQSMTTPAANLRVLKKQNWNITLHNRACRSHTTLWIQADRCFLWLIMNVCCYAEKKRKSSGGKGERKGLRLIWKSGCELCTTPSRRIHVWSVHVFLMMITSRPEGSPDLCCKYRPRSKHNGLYLLAEKQRSEAAAPRLSAAAVHAFRRERVGWSFTFRLNVELYAPRRAANHSVCISVRSVKLAGNPRVWEAGTVKCLVIFIDEWQTRTEIAAD